MAKEISIILMLVELAVPSPVLLLM